MVRDRLWEPSRHRPEHALQADHSDTMQSRRSDRTLMDTPGTVMRVPLSIMNSVTKPANDETQGERVQQSRRRCHRVQKHALEGTARTPHTPHTPGTVTEMSSNTSGSNSGRGGSVMVAWVRPNCGKKASDRQGGIGGD